MQEYRKRITHNPDAHYWFVEMGPIPGMPGWHTKLYESNSYPFPSEEAAKRFAMGVRERDWKREAWIRYPDGSRREVPLIGEDWND